MQYRSFGEKMFRVNPTGNNSFQKTYIILDYMRNHVSVTFQRDNIHLLMRIAGSAGFNIKQISGCDCSHNILKGNISFGLQ